MIDIISEIAIIFLVCVFVYPFLLCLIDKHKGTHYSCKQFGWHDGKGVRENGEKFDGCSNLAVCSKCGKDVMQDSQGNWF